MRFASRGDPARVEVCEIFASIQGESSFAGWPCLLIRLAGCPFRCWYCDTAYAFESGVSRSVSEVLRQTLEHGLDLVELTGGEPLAQTGGWRLASELADRGYTVLIETGGGVSIAGRDPRVRMILDLKTPASGFCEQQHLDTLDHLLPHDEIKFVLCSREDYLWARSMLETHELTSRHLVHFAPVELGDGLIAPSGVEGITKQELSNWILEDRLRVRFNLQLHRWIWGSGARGV